MPTTQQRLAIVGDLHYETSQHAALIHAQQQLVALEPHAVVSLGDQGGYSHCGTRLSFTEGYEYFSGFGVPFHALIGNHDMEGAEFKKDKDAVAAWCEVFEQERPYTTVDWGTAVGVILSQTSFRGNLGSHHEVHIDQAQLDWFAHTLAEYADRPIMVFSHAPILGSGIRVLQDLHLKGPNAYLNHYTYPERFMELVQANPHIKLWFSGHNHLGHDYQDTITHVGHCTFVHGGVIGNHTRDGRRHTRFLTFDHTGFDLHTVNHADGRLRQDIRVDFAQNQMIRYQQFPPQDLARYFPPPPYPNGQGITVGNSVLLHHRDMLVEYDRTLAAPIGVVADNLNGAQVDVEGDVVVIRHSSGVVNRRAPNAYGRYLYTYFPNPWRQEK